MIALLLVLFISQPVEAKELGKVADKYAKQFNIDRRLVRAIIKVESNWDNSAVSNTNDYGLMQINKNTITYFNFDLKKIKKDPDYAVYCGVFYLAHLRYRYGLKDKYWWARYHSSTPHLKRKYIRRVLDVYNPEDKKATPRRYYSQTWDTEFIWSRPIIVGRPFYFTKSN